MTGLALSRMLPAEPDTGWVADHLRLSDNAEGISHVLGISPVQSRSVEQLINRLCPPLDLEVTQHGRANSILVTQAIPLRWLSRRQIQL